MNDGLSENMVVVGYHDDHPEECPCGTEWIRRWLLVLNDPAFGRCLIGEIGQRKMRLDSEPEPCRVVHLMESPHYYAETPDIHSAIAVCIRGLNRHLKMCIALNTQIRPTLQQGV